MYVFKSNRKKITREVRIPFVALWRFGFMDGWKQQKHGKVFLFIIATGKDREVVARLSTSLSLDVG